MDGITNPRYHSHSQISWIWISNYSARGPPTASSIITSGECDDWADDLENPMILKDPHLWHRLGWAY